MSTPKTTTREEEEVPALVDFHAMTTFLKNDQEEDGTNIRLETMQEFGARLAQLHEGVTALAKEARMQALMGQILAECSNATSRRTSLFIQSEFILQEMESGSAAMDVALGGRLPPKRVWYRCPASDCQHQPAFADRRALRLHLQAKHLVPTLYTCFVHGCWEVYPTTDLLCTHFTSAHALLLKDLCDEDVQFT